MNSYPTWCHGKLSWKCRQCRVSSKVPTCDTTPTCRRHVGDNPYVEDKSTYIYSTLLGILRNTKTCRDMSSNCWHVGMSPGNCRHTTRHTTCRQHFQLRRQVWIRTQHAVMARMNSCLLLLMIAVHDISAIAIIEDQEKLVDPVWIHHSCLPALPVRSFSHA